VRLIYSGTNWKPSDQRATIQAKEAEEPRPLSAIPPEGAFTRRA